MSASPWNLPLAVMMIVLGMVFAWYERRMAFLLPTFSERIRPFLAQQTRRRFRVASLFIMIGVLMVCGHWTDPQLHPIRFLIVGLTTTVFSITLLAYGVADYHAARLRRQEADGRARARRAEAHQIPSSLGNHRLNEAKSSAKDAAPPSPRSSSND